MAFRLFLQPVRLPELFMSLSLLTPTAACSVCRRSFYRHRADSKNLGARRVALKSSRSAGKCTWTIYCISLYPADNVQIHRKPIYDEPPDNLPPNHTSSSSIPSEPAKPTPTDRLAEQIRHARLYLHGHAASLEDHTNGLLSRAFSLEHSFTSTVASLAPPKSSNERLMPGAIYVLIAAMGSSILVRNRNFLVRWTVPFAVGIGTAWAVIPITSRNVGDLVWKYEERFPVVADTHTRVSEGVKNFVQTGVAHSKMGAAMLEGKVGDVRKSIEDWVSKGK